MATNWRVKLKILNLSKLYLDIYVGLSLNMTLSQGDISWWNFWNLKFRSPQVCAVKHFWSSLSTYWSFKRSENLWVSPENFVDKKCDYHNFSHFCRVKLIWRHVMILGAPTIMLVVAMIGNLLLEESWRLIALQTSTKWVGRVLCGRIPLCVLWNRLALSVHPLVEVLVQVHLTFKVFAGALCKQIKVSFLLLLLLIWFLLCVDLELVRFKNCWGTRTLFLPRYSSL